jgi:uncharacterized protein YuzE
MNITYNPDVDVLRIVFSLSQILGNDEENPGHIIDYDAERNIIGMEILDAFRRIENLNLIELLCFSLYMK